MMQGRTGAGGVGERLLLWVGTSTCCRWHAGVSYKNPYLELAIPRKSFAYDTGRGCHVIYSAEITS